MAILGIGKKKQKLRAQTAAATVASIVAKGEAVSSYDRNSLLYSSDGKVTSKERKLLKNQLRQESKSERSANVQAEKSYRSDRRQSTRSTAYASGIDPNAWAGNLVGNLSGGLGGLLGGIGIGNNQGSGTTVEDVFESGSDRLSEMMEPEKDNKILIIGAIVLAFLLFKKK
jgi:hypothetical protein